MKRILKIVGFLIGIWGLYRLNRRMSRRYIPLGIEVPYSALGFECHPLPPAKQTKFKFRYAIATASIIILAVIGFFWQSHINIDFLQTSVFDTDDIIFDGTITPIDKVPNWPKLTSAEYSYAYAQIPSTKLVTMPPYDPASILRGKNASASDTDRIAYLTYSVPYMGTYRMDGRENTGSHLAVDLKTPLGTPVRSIANGRVIKVDYAASGYGHHICIAHGKVPVDDSGNTERLISCYAHLSETSVSEGQKVTKGTQIGKVGNSGMTTGYHLHFQVETEDAPFHPYWPYDMSDVTASGYSAYSDGINYGIGKAKAVKYTVNPFTFIAANTNYKDIPAVVTTPQTDDTDTVVVEDDTTTPVAYKPANTPSDTSETAYTGDPSGTEQTPSQTVTDSTSYHGSAPSSTYDSDTAIAFEEKRTFIPSSPVYLKVYLNDENLIASNGIELSSTLRNLASVQPTYLTANDFNNGIAEIKVNTGSNATFKVIATGDFGEIRSKSLRAQVFTDVAYSDLYGEAISYLKENNIINGYPDGSFKPQGTLNRAEAVKILLNGNNISVGKNQNQFSDVEEEQWYTDYVTTAAKRGIVSGYSDTGEFKPARTISRAEFLKVAIKTAGFDPSFPEIKPYPDTEVTDWFAPFVNFSKEHELLTAKRGGYIVPHDPITREEAANIIYKLSQL